MDNVSVSKGVFAYRGAYRIGQGRGRQNRDDSFDQEPWYAAFKENWRIIQDSFEKLRAEMFIQILTDVKTFVEKAKEKPLRTLGNEIPTAILLTGVNVPDHGVLFEALRSKLEEVTRRVCIVWSRDSGNLKTLLEEVVYQIINNGGEEIVKKGQCTMRNLKLWHAENCDEEEPFVILITDFESSAASVLHDFISVLSSYASSMKFILIFGVATTLHAIHRSLSYDVTSKLNVQVFHTKTQVNTLSIVLENVVLREDIPFRLTGRAFQLLTDIFLFYDFSVESFLQGYKNCMIQHFYENKLSSLCARREKLRQRLRELSGEARKEARNIPSVEKYLKSNNLESLNDQQFEAELLQLLEQFHERVERFLVMLRCLHSITSNLPNSPMGKQLREFYTKAVYQQRLTDSPEYKECLQLLSFLSKRELLDGLRRILEILKGSKDRRLAEVRADLETHRTRIEEAAIEISSTTVEEFTVEEKMSRAQLKERLLKLSQKKARSAYREAQLELIEFLDKEFATHLVNPGQYPAAEIFCFSDGLVAKHSIRGSSRAAVHAALTDPQFYLNCDCCKLESDEAIKSTLPDLSIVYKLHLESRKLINIYDWLQAFLVIVDPQTSGEQRDVDPKLQARFTRAVAELEFLGFVKSSTKKTDHVKRLG